MGRIRLVGRWGRPVRNEWLFDFPYLCVCSVVVFLLVCCCCDLGVRVTIDVVWCVVVSSVEYCVSTDWSDVASAPMSVEWPKYM